LQFLAAEAAFMTTSTPSALPLSHQHQQRKDDALGRRFDGIPAHQWSQYNHHSKIFCRQAAKRDAMASSSLSSSEQEIKEETRIGGRESTRTTALHSTCNKRDGKWLKQYTNLKAYYATHEHCNVPQKDGTLGQWVTNQRTALRLDRMQGDRKCLLDEIGFSWSNVTDKKWMERYETLKAYRTQQGHCNVPSTERPLGLWITTQRCALRKDRLRQDRKELLDEIGFVWSLNRGSGSSDERWVDQYKHVKAFRDEHGHCNVPKRQGSLGRWVEVQRRFYRNGSLRPDRKELLDEIGFVWIIVANTELLAAAKDSKYWLEQYERLKAFRNENGHCNVPSLSEGSLGLWVITQRHTYKKGSMRQERKELLEKIGFAFNLHEERWRQNFKELKRFQIENGHCRVPLKETPLRTWADAQRTAFKKGRMRTYRVEQLEKIDFFGCAAASM
jgi:hypothetical protein